MKRYLQSAILADLPNKIVLLTGPRQCGKTTLAKQLTDSYDYLNYDAPAHRLILKEQSWDRSNSLIIFDELHKMNAWKRWLKGVYDTEGIPPQLLVTGSARLDIHKKMGDSLAGRYFQFRMHPIDLKEAVEAELGNKEELFQTLWECSGFPEPFLNKDPIFYRRWQKTHTEIILRQDLLSLYSGRDIQAIETLVLLLQQRVGASVSYTSLARDLERDANTIKRWLQLLENLYIIYRVVPYHKNIARSLLKEPKFYFYDHAVIADEGARLENLVANALLKQLQWREDTEGVVTRLHYLRTKDGREVDFLVVIDKKPIIMIEVKSSDDSLSSHFSYFKKHMDTRRLQLVKNLAREKTMPTGEEVRALVPWLAQGIGSL